MPKSRKPSRRKTGDTRPVRTARSVTSKCPTPRADPRQSGKTQMRGGRPPLFPGRTGGR